MCTRAHRDHKDDTICVVLEFSDCEGGEIVLFEPGVVIKLGEGRGCIFTSAITTHFNLDYVGERTSLVFSTDKDGKGWVDGNRGGWGCSLTFKKVDYEH